MGDSSSRMRKPLSDINNMYNLTPTAHLEKLVAPFNRYSFRNSSQKSNSSSTNHNFCSQSSNRSSTSIASSNVNSATSRSKTQFLNSPPPISSIASPGGVGSKDAVHNRSQTIEMSKTKRVVDVFDSRTPVEKRKDKGNAIAVPLSSPSTENIKDNQNDICNPSTPVEGPNQKGMANLGLSSGSAEIVKESEKEIKTKKGKAILSSSACPLGKQTEKRKGIDANTLCLLEKTNDQKGLEHSGSSILKTKETGQESLNPSGFLVERAKNKENPLNFFNSSHERTQKKGKVILQPSDIVEIANHKRSSASVAVKSKPPRRKSEKRKNDAGASSCPPMMKTKYIKNDLDEAGDIKNSKSWTDPHPKSRKKRCSGNANATELPRDFIEQQKAYFKEVDEFELPEEEATPDELD